MPGPVTVTMLLLAGIAMGMVFFGGLWFTVRVLPTSRYPAALAVASFWSRTALAVAAFAWVCSRGWQNALTFLAGFVAARLLMARWIPPRNVTRRNAE